jgi:hypothetical protein
MSTLDTVITDVSKVVKTLAPFIEAAIPTAAPAIAIAVAIIQGVIVAEPIAVALFNQIMAGTPATPAQLAVYISANNLANAQTDADIASALAKIAAAAKP